MIAVYFYQHLRGPKIWKEGQYIVPVKSDDFLDFLDIVAVNKKYPFPSSDVVFIENDIEVNRFDPYES